MDFNYYTDHFFIISFRYEKNQSFDLAASFNHLKSINSETLE